MKISEPLDQRLSTEANKADYFEHRCVKALDDLIRGYYKGSFNLIASRPAMRNTSMLCSLTYHASRIKSKVYLLSLQHASSEILNRILQINSLWMAPK